MINLRELINQFSLNIAGGWKVQAAPKRPGSARRRKTGTATNSRLWNWIAVPALPPEPSPTGQSRRQARIYFCQIVCPHFNSFPPLNHLLTSNPLLQASATLKPGRSVGKHGIFEPPGGPSFFGPPGARVLPHSLTRKASDRKSTRLNS